MTLATSAYEAHCLDALATALRRAQESLGGHDQEQAVCRLKAARQQITNTIKRLEARP